MRRFFSGGEGGIRILSPQWGRENLNKENAPVVRRFFSGGEGGIRTREPLWVTRFPSVRAKPDYATSPFLVQAGKLYHVSLFLSNCELHQGKCYFILSCQPPSQSNPFDTVSESRTVRTPASTISSPSCTYTRTVTRSVPCCKTRLIKNGVGNWFDKEKLLTGRDLALEIRKAVRENIDLKSQSFFRN